MKTIHKYLLRKGLADSTIKQHERNVSIFLNWLETESQYEKDCGYSEMIRFIDSPTITSLGSRVNKNNLNRILTSVTYYFDSIAEKSPSQINPARNIRIKCNKKRLVHDLLEYDELVVLYRHFKSKTPRQVRNHVILGFLIFQGLTSAEVQKLKIEDLRFEEGSVLVNGDNNNSLKKGTASRMLPLEAIQMVDLIYYLDIIRPKILTGKYLSTSGRKPKRNRRVNNTNQVILSLKGSPNLKNTLHHLFIDLKRVNPKVISSRQLRQSLIAYWLTKHNLRKVQYMAGHRFVSSTEWYKGSNLEDLKREINVYHPLKLSYSDVFYEFPQIISS
jgi:integrase/recombinase XerD